MVSLKDKEICFNNGYYADYLNYIKMLYFRDKLVNYGEISNNLTLEEIEKSIEIYEQFASQNEENERLFDCCRRLYKARKEKVRRIKKKLKYLLSCGSCLFCTFTWSDENLQKLSPKTRRRYVIDFAGSQSSLFLGNIDFNGENHREHYHFIIRSDFIKAGSWSYGFDYYEKINISLENENDSVKKISKYLNKIVNHSVKISTGCNSVIYSKALLERSFLPPNIVRYVKKDGTIFTDVITLEEVTEEELLNLENIF